MASDIIPITLADGGAHPVVLSDEDRKRVQGARVASKADSTRRTYRSQWTRWAAWAEAREAEPLPAPPALLEAYLAERASEGASPATLRSALAAIKYAHLLSGQSDPVTPEIQETMRGITAIAGSAQAQATGLTSEGMAAVRATASIPRTGRGRKRESRGYAERRGAEDVALLGLMRDALLRIGEVAALIWADVEQYDDGTGRLLVRKSKTDREGRGAVLYISRQTMADLSRVRNGRGESERVFELSVRQIRNRIKAACEAAGLGGRYSGHSARIGMARDLARSGVELTALMNAGRWRSHNMPAHYTRAETAGRGAVARFYGDG